MKKGLFVLALTAMVFSAVGFSAPAQAAQKLDLAICGGSIGGAWAAIGEGVGEVVRRSYPGSNTAYEVGQEAANLALVSRGKIQLGIAQIGAVVFPVEISQRSVDLEQSRCVGLGHFRF